VIPDSLDGGLSFALSNYLKKLKQQAIQAKNESDRIAQLKQAKENAASTTSSQGSPINLNLGISTGTHLKAVRTVSYPQSLATSPKGYHQLLDR
jgi:hypothetical protein